MVTVFFSVVTIFFFPRLPSGLFFNQVHSDVGCLYILHSAVEQIHAPWGKMYDCITHEQCIFIFFFAGKSEVACEIGV